MKCHNKTHDQSVLDLQVNFPICEVARLRAEVARLRELCRDAMTFICTYTSAPHIQGASTIWKRGCHCEFGCDIRERLEAAGREEGQG